MGSANRHRLSWSVLLACFVLLGVGTPSRAVHRILVVGDSWAAGAGPRFQGVLNAQGHADKSALNLGLPGQTAALLNTPGFLDQISIALAANPTIDIVFLSIGGNDLLGGWNNGSTPAQEAALWAGVQANVQAIVDHILAQGPDLQVVIASYDYPNLWDTVIADPFGPAGVLWLALGQPSPGRLNRAFFGDQSCAGGGSSDGLEDFKRAVAQQSSRVHYSDIEGFMQVATHGFCHIDFPGPTGFLANGGTDPIHLSNAGYDIYVTQAFNTAFAGLFAGPVLGTNPTAGASVDFGLVRAGTSGASAALVAANLGPVGSRLEVSFGSGSGAFSGGGGALRYLFREQSPPAGDTAFGLYQFAPGARGGFSQAVGVASNGGAANFTLNGQGVGPVFSASLPALDFGAVPAGDTEALPLSVQNVSPDPNGSDPSLTSLTLRAAVFSGANPGQFQLQGFTPGQVLGVGQSVALQVTFQPGPAAGPRSANLVIETDAGVGSGAPGLIYSIPVSGESVSPTPTPTPTPTPLSQCSDGLDNDGDGLVDQAGGDSGCRSPTSPIENPACNDGNINDFEGDGIDFDGGAEASQGGALCTGSGIPLGCCTGFGTGCDGAPDPQCMGRPWKNTEKKAACGLGIELVLLLPGLMGLRRRRA